MRPRNERVTRVLRYLPIDDDDVETFNDILSDEIDLDFASSICCCEHCYRDFREHWPDVAFRGVESEYERGVTRVRSQHCSQSTVFSKLGISIFLSRSKRQVVARLLR